MTPQNKKAIIFSKNKKLCRLVEIELVLCGYTVSVQRSTEIRSSSKHPEQKYDCLIFDATDRTDDTNEVVTQNLPESSFAISIIDEKSAPVDADFDVVIEYPFFIDELRALLTENQKAARTVTSAGIMEQGIEKCFYVDYDSKTVIFNDTPISLSDYELKTLRLLCENKGRYISREALSRELGAEEGNIGDVYVCHLRRKLEAPFGIKVIYTARGKGYYTDYTIRT